MTNRIKPTEWEALSAYLDNQLSPEDRARLDARLKQEPEMSQALEELRRTRIILRSQPRMRAPRNFTLTPTMAGVRSRRHRLATPFSVMRLASVLATVFLVFVTVGDLAVRRFAPAPTTISIVEQAPQPIRGMGGGGGGGGMDPVSTEAAVEAAAEAPPDAASEAPLDAVAEASQIPDQFSLEVTPLGETPETETALKQAQDPGPETRNGLEPSRESETPAAAVSSGSARASLLIRFLQISLGLLALIAGIAALILRRSAG